MRQPTIWENLVAKLGRNPTNEECRVECRRIITEGMLERAAAGKLPHQRKRGRHRA